MNMLYHILPRDTVDKLVKDARNLYNMNRKICRTEEDLNRVLYSRLNYYKSQCTYGNPIQEAIVSDSIWRVVNSLPDTDGLYDN